MRKVLIAMVVFSSCAARVCDFYGGVEALYWKPTHCPIPFARGVDNDNVDRHKILSFEGDYDWGFRLRIGGVDECCRFTDVAYHWVETKDSGSAPADAFAPYVLPGMDVSVDFVRANMHTRYQGLDWRVGYAFEVCCSELRFFADVRWTDLDLTVDCSGPANNDPEFTRRLSYSGSYNAGGVGLGIEGIFPLWCKVSLMTRAGMVPLIGKSKVERLVSVNRPDPDVFVPYSTTMVNPLFDVRVELSYPFCVCNRDWIAKLGYELDYILNPLQYWTSAKGDRETGQDAFPIVGCEDFGYGGIYFGVSASF